MESPTPIQNIPLFIPSFRQEAKIECFDDNHPVLASFGTYNQASLADNQTDLNKTFLGYLTGKLQSPSITTTSPTLWSGLLPDFLTLRAFAHLKSESLSFPNFYHASNERKPSNSKNGLINDTRSASDQMIAKKEEPIEHKACNCGAIHTNYDKNSKKEEEKEIPMKPPKNFKNIYGLILQKVKSSIEAYSALVFKQKRLDYVDKVVCTLDTSEKEQFLTFLGGYQKNWKKCTIIQNFLRTDYKYGRILLDVVLGFFGPDGLAGFSIWLISENMDEKLKAAVIQKKEGIRTEFSKMLLIYENKDKNSDS